jgi:hypothetical protein
MLNRVYLCCQVLQIVLVKNAPKDQWNLAINGIRIMQANNTFYVAVGGEPAPYAEITNENWDKFKAPLKGKVNPNEGWIDRSIEEAKPLIEQIMGGALTEQEVREFMLEKYEKDIDKQYQEHIKDLKFKLDKIKVKPI